jgi:hypothetical protein
MIGQLVVHRVHQIYQHNCLQGHKPKGTDTYPFHFDGGDYVPTKHW